MCAWDGVMRADIMWCSLIIFGCGVCRVGCCPSDSSNVHHRTHIRISRYALRPSHILDTAQLMPDYAAHTVMHPIPNHVLRSTPRRAHPASCPALNLPPTHLSSQLAIAAFKLKLKPNQSSRPQACSNTYLELVAPAS
ncbi:hypothetical protein BDQ17DRAFT_1035082 [Cyathus striatus]|nr:hypothetical protein BDQ17DRAFT_1035082 [Cyathus striatus]